MGKLAYDRQLAYDHQLAYALVVIRPPAMICNSGAAVASKALRRLASPEIVQFGRRPWLSLIRIFSLWVRARSPVACIFAYFDYHCFFVDVLEGA